MTTNWEILNTERHPETGYISRVFWKVTGQQDGTSLNYEGTTEFKEYDPESTLIPYPELTEQIIIEWVQEVENAESISVILLQGIQELLKPQPVSGLPWN